MSKLCTCDSIDHKIVHDDLILENMFKLEEYYIIQNCYFNSKITNEIRSTLSVWMLEVCEEEKLTNDIFYLSMNLFDRFMCALVANNKFQVNKSHLQLFGTCCLFIASKLRSSQHLNAFKLIEYTDNSIRLDDLLELELLILDKLKWDTDSISPNDYLEIFLHRLNLNQNKHIELIKRHFHAFTALCSTELKFSFYPSSMIASSCLLAAIDGLKSQLNINLKKIELKLIKLITIYGQIDLEFLKVLKEQINDLLNKSVPSQEINSQVDDIKKNEKNIIIEDDYEIFMDISNSNRDFEDSLFTSETSLTNLSINCKETFHNSNEINKNMKLNKNRSSTSSTESGTSSVYDSLYSSSAKSNQNYFLLTPPLANLLPLPTF